VNFSADGSYLNPSIRGKMAGMPAIICLSGRLSKRVGHQRRAKGW
jgi:hypothetical protein